ncbi:MAG: flagellar filament capping protein FliD [Planctomycetota bacterium]|jgi:flagellar hook-associated protein 2
MGGISLGTGLFSGIDSRTLIDQLMQIEARPRVLVQQRIIALRTQQASYIDLNSQLLALKTAAAQFNSLDVFQAKTASSSDPDILDVGATKFASPGQYNIQVDSLVTTAQTITRGFADADLSGLGAAEFSFEVGGGRVDAETLLSELNGGAGIKRGTFVITDEAGASATIDLSKAITANDVLDAINASGIGVSATIDDDRFVLTDTTDTPGGSELTVTETFGGTTAASLGILGSSTSDVLTGTEVYALGENTPLALLRDGLGVQFGDGGPGALEDMQITVQDAGGGNATDYKILLGEIGSFQDHDGDTETPDEWVVDEGGVVTVGDLFDRIELQTSGEVTGAISADGTSIELTAAGGRELTATDEPDRTTASDLGITGTTAASITSDRLFGSINTVLLSRLNGGSGIGAGTFDITQRDGTSFSVTVGTGDTLQDVLTQINANAGISATVSGTGNGITITDSTTGGSLIIADTSGTAAADLGIDTAGESTGVVGSGNQQVQWLSNATRLEDLNGGAGVGTGDFIITDSGGANATVSVTASHKTLNDVIELINGRGLDILAELNDQGDGIVIRDTGGGSNAIKIEDTGGTVGKKLNLVGEADWTGGDSAADNIIDGSFERTVTLDAGDTLQDISDKINSAGVGVGASVIGVGGGPTPYRLVFTSDATGSAGRFVVETNGFDIGAEQLSRGRDAVAFFGSSNPAEALLVTSSTNTLDELINGVTIDLKATSASPVEVTVSQDTGKIEDTISGFVEAYNTVIDSINQHTAFDQETQRRGALFGDITVQNIRSTMQRTMQAKPLNAPGQFEYLFQVGIRIGDGGKIEFDRDDFRDAYAQDPEAVENLLAAFEQERTDGEILDENGDPIDGVTSGESQIVDTSLGVMELFEQMAESFTDSISGLLTNRRSTLDTQISAQEDRIDAINAQLEVKRGKLEREFLQMEQIIGSLQTQSQALNSLSLGG